ncbi:MAG: phage integrase [Marinomonas sp.]
MSIKQTKDGWKVDFRAGGANGKRYRKTCRTKAEAERYQKFVEAQHTTTGKPWEPRQSDTRRLSDLIDLWYKHHGQNLTYNQKRLSKLKNTAAGLGNPLARELTPAQYSAYRAARISQGRAIKTINTEMIFINAVYNQLQKINVIDYPSPLSSLAKLKEKEKEMHYLESTQIVELLHALKPYPNAELIARICLETGARWGEAENLTTGKTKNQKATFTETKSGKNRTIPISSELSKRLAEHAKSGQLFEPSAKHFYAALDKTTIKLPKGQKTHVLRHTFASHFIINGGNILTLQKILGHSDIKMTLKYSHLAPDHLNDCLTFNPLNSLGLV